MQNTNLPRFINNNGGNDKTVSTTGWVYLGTNITIPDGYVAILYAQRGYHTGKPNGVCISTSSTDMANVIRAINQPTDAEYNSHIVHVAMLAGAGTYYLWSKGAIGISSEFIHAILIKIK